MPETKFRLYVGQEVTVTDERGKREVVVIDFDNRNKQVFVQNEDANCEWVSRAVITEMVP